MIKHTPGTWKAVQPTAIDYRAMQIQTDDSLIAVCCGGGPKRAIGAPEGRANARPIAAAPDLLAVCKDIYDFLRRSGYDTRLVKAAIQEAEGSDEVGEQGLRPSSDGANP